MTDIERHVRGQISKERKDMKPEIQETHPD